MLGRERNCRSFWAQSFAASSTLAPEPSILRIIPPEIFASWANTETIPVLLYWAMALTGSSINDKRDLEREAITKMLGNARK